MINLDEICDCCGGYGNQPFIQLFDDKCFRIVDGKETYSDFCLKDFAFPVDGNQCINFTVMLNGGEVTIFDNSLNLISPSGVLESGKLYARGVMIKVTYPSLDENGEEISLVDKNVIIEMEDSASLIGVQYPLHNFFSIFTNPKSNNSAELINKIKILNPNLLYNVRVSALVLYGKAV